MVHEADDVDDVDTVQALSVVSQRAVMTLCKPPVVETPQAVSFLSVAVRPSGFFSGTLPLPGVHPQTVIAQAQQIARESGRTHFVWAAEASALGLACWQQQLAPAYPLAVMATTTPHPPTQVSGEGVVLVTDHDTADLFRQVHLDRFAAAPNAPELVDHFASDHVLLDTTVRAVIVMDQQRPAAVGYLHTTDQVSGIYWVATARAFQRRGHAATVTSTLLSLAPPDRPVVLQATAMGRPVYLRHGFHDHGMVWCWAATA